MQQVRNLAAFLKRLEKLAKGNNSNQDKIIEQESDMVRFYFSDNLAIHVEDYLRWCQRDLW